MPNENCLAGFKCPKCEQEDVFRIVGKTTFKVTDEGSEAIGDHNWEDSSFCMCPQCNHQGTVGEFTGGRKAKPGAPDRCVVAIRRGEVIAVYARKGCDVHITDDDGSADFAKWMKKVVKGLVQH